MKNNEIEEKEGKVLVNKEEYSLLGNIGDVSIEDAAVGRKAMESLQNYSYFNLPKIINSYTYITSNNVKNGEKLIRIGKIRMNSHKNTYSDYSDEILGVA